MEQVDVYEREREKADECQHEWDIDDQGDEGTGEGYIAYEYCKKCGKKSGK